MEQENKTENSSNGNFLKSMIEINNPSWTAEQIDLEFKRQMEANENGADEVCDVCSS